MRLFRENRRETFKDVELNKKKTKLTLLEFGLTFHHIRHKTAFDNEPYAAWNVKKAGLDGQEYRHPLVIRIVEVSPRVCSILFSCAWKIKCVWNIKTTVHPTVTV